MMVSVGCWTPDGTYLLYAQGLAIMMMNQDGSEPHLLAKVSGVVRTLRFPPDGRRIRFHIIHDMASSDSIWEMNANGMERIFILFFRIGRRLHSNAAEIGPRMANTIISRQVGQLHRISG
jgi:hypothetical protein